MFVDERVALRDSSKCIVHVEPAGEASAPDIHVAYQGAVHYDVLEPAEGPGSQGLWSIGTGPISSRATLSSWGVERGPFFPHGRLGLVCLAAVHLAATPSSESYELPR